MSGARSRRLRRFGPLSAGLALAALATLLSSCGDEPKNPPRLTGFSPAIASVDVNESLEISVNYQENDYPLDDFQWTAEAGTIEGNGKPRVTYQAPDAAGDYQLSVTIVYADTDDAKLSLDTVVKVLPAEPATAAVAETPPAESAPAMPPAAESESATPAETATSSDETTPEATAAATEAPPLGATPALETPPINQPPKSAEQIDSDSTPPEATPPASAESDTTGAPAPATEPPTTEPATAEPATTGDESDTTEPPVAAAQSATAEAVATAGETADAGDQDAGSPPSGDASDPADSAASDAAGGSVDAGQTGTTEADTTAVADPATADTATDTAAATTTPESAPSGEGDGAPAAAPAASAAGTQLAARTPPGAETSPSRIDRIRERGQLDAIVQIEFEPFSFYGEAGQRVGFDIDLARELARRWLDDPNAVVFLPVPTDARITNLLNGKGDLIIAALTDNAERRTQIDFSTTYLMDGQRLLVPESSSVVDVCGLKGQKVAAIRASTSLDNLKQVATDCGFDITPDLVEFRRHADAVAALVAGEVAAFTSDGLALEGFAKGQPLQVVGNHFSEEPYGIGLPKGDERLGQLVDATLAEMQADGTYAALYDKWFGDSLEPFPLAVEVPADAAEVAALITSDAPEVVEPAPDQAPPPSEYEVQPGDTLSKIAGKVWGDVSPNSWKRIYEANRELIGDNPALIEVGMRLAIPPA